MELQLSQGRVVKGIMGTGICLFCTVKLAFRHWDWDLKTGKGINNFENGNGISLLWLSPTLLFDTTVQMSLF